MAPCGLPKEECVAYESKQDNPGDLPKVEGVAHESEHDTPSDLPNEESVAHESEQDTPGDLPKEEGAALVTLRELEVRSGLPSGAAPGCLVAILSLWFRYYNTDNSKPSGFRNLFHLVKGITTTTYYDFGLYKVISRERICSDT